MYADQLTFNKIVGSSETDIKFLSRDADCDDKQISHFADLQRCKKNKINEIWTWKIDYNTVGMQTGYLNTFTRGFTSISSFLKMLPTSFMMSFKDSHVNDDWWRLKNITADWTCWTLPSLIASKYKWQKIGKSNCDSSCLHFALLNSCIQFFSLQNRNNKKKDI